MFRIVADFIVLSSANKKISINLKFVVISLMRTKNNSGPITDVVTDRI